MFTCKVAEIKARGGRKRWYSKGNSLGLVDIVESIPVYRGFVVISP